MHKDTKAQIASYSEPDIKYPLGSPKRRSKPRKKRAPGRPEGQRAAQLELQEYMYAHPKKKEVVEEMMLAALDSNHKNQGIAWKILMDRMLPVSGFEKLQGRSQISINITTLGVTQADVVTGDVIDGELVD